MLYIRELCELFVAPDVTAVMKTERIMWAVLKVSSSDRGIAKGILNCNMDGKRRLVGQNSEGLMMLSRH
jgi:hypothetical protein